MAPEILQPGAMEAESSWMTGTSNNAPPGETQQQRRLQLVHRDVAIAALETMTLDAHRNIESKSGSSKNKKEHGIGYESIHLEVDNGQVTVSHTAGVRRELRAQFIAADNGKPPRLTKASDRTLHRIEHHDSVSSGIFTPEMGDKFPGNRRNTLYRR